MNLSRQAEFEQLMEEHQSMLKSSARTFYKCLEDQEDLVQETLAMAFKKFHLFESGTSFGGWSKTIMRNLFFTRFKREKRINEVHRAYKVDKELLLSIRKHEMTVEENQVSDLVLNSVNQIKEPFREVLILYAAQEFAYSEIAEELNIPVGTVMSRLFRGRNEGKEMLREYAQEEYGIGNNI